VQGRALLKAEKFLKGLGKLFSKSFPSGVRGRALRKIVAKQITDQRESRARGARLFM